MALLPTLSYEYTDREVTDTFRGYRHQLKIDEGEFYDMRNLTSENAPLLANRRRRGRVRVLQSPGGLLAKEKLAWVEDGCLYYDGTATALTGLSAGKKQLVSMGAYIVVFPDKKYYNTADPTDRGSLGALYTSAGAVEYTLCKADGTACRQPTVSDTAPEEPDNAALWIDTSQQTHVLRQWSAAQSAWNEITTVYTRLRFLSEGELPGLFSVYDGVRISGAAPDGIDGDRIIYAVGGGEGVLDYIVVTGLLEQAVTQTTGSVRIERSVPELDFVIECQNRLWGCRSGTEDGKTLNELYCCALGDFRNWRQYMGLSTDSWTASVGSDGPWTGAVNYLGCPMFFKENRIHRITVSASGAHAVSETVCRGVQAGSAQSLQVVNETLFYKSRSDVCVYQGGFPQSISEPLGPELFSDAAAGAVGERYYLSVRGADGGWRLFVYDIRHGVWMREDELHVETFARLGDELYALTGEGELLALLGSEGEREPFVAWEAETGMLSWQHPDRKYVSRFNLRLYMEEGAELSAWLMYDSDGTWVRQGRIRTRGTRTVTLPIRPRRCDHLRMKLVGKGEVRLYSIAKILTYGSDVG
ncbi:MAG: hypothetical protein K6F56_09475 [Oscillospiraceae bacterium]|nr:hypothetical protein [Oscillospiraceae bacterium]